MIVWKKIKRHRRNFREQFVERRCVSGSRNVVAVPAPNRRLLVPGGRNRKDHWSGHAGSQFVPLASKSTITSQAVEGGRPFLSPPALSAVHASRPCLSGR